MGRTATDPAMLADLEALDTLLARAVSAAHAAFGVGPGEDPYRGLRVTGSDVDALLGRPPGGGLLTPGATLAPAARGWTRLQDAFGLSAFELDVVLIALAPEVDLRYERIYGYLQDDVTRRRPSVELCLNLLCTSRAEKLERLAYVFGPGPLLRSGAATLASDPDLLEAPLAGRTVVLDQRVVAFLLGSRDADARLTRCARLTETAAGPCPDALVGLARDGGVALHVPEGAGPLAAALAGRLGAPLLTVEVERALDDDPGLDRIPALVRREAALSGAVVALEGTGAVAAGGRDTAARRLGDELVDAVVVLDGDDATRDAVAPAAVVVELPAPTPPERRAAWAEALEAEGVAPVALDELADRFRLGPAQRRAAVRAAARRAQLRGGAPDRDDVLGAARAASAAHLGSHARKLRTRRRWDDLVLPEDRRGQLRDLADAIRHRATVYSDWGFAEKLTSGTGISVLFAGPSGTGKTMAAEVIASELGLDLYRIDLSTVVSKYIGETEKNLAHVFAAAEGGSGMLFFDEADALFGRRSEVRDAHDRYANIETGYLLQAMESYDGVAILASNLRKNMDEAFVRRLQFTVDFPFPRTEDRHRIWEAIWPDALPLADDVDLGALAGRFELTGGGIRNVALGASFLAAADGRVVTMDHLLRATRRELQKMGKVLSPADLEDTRWTTT